MKKNIGGLCFHQEYNFNLQCKHVANKKEISKCQIFGVKGFPIIDIMEIDREYGCPISYRSLKYICIYKLTLCLLSLQKVSMKEGILIHFLSISLLQAFCDDHHKKRDGVHMY